MQFDGTVSLILLLNTDLAEPGFAGDIGAIKVWLIDWLIEALEYSFMIIMYLLVLTSQ